MPYSSHTLDRIDSGHNKGNMEVYTMNEAAEFLAKELAQELPKLNNNGGVTSNGILNAGSNRGVCVLIVTWLMVSCSTPLLD